MRKSVLWITEPEKIILGGESSVFWPQIAIYGFAIESPITKIVTIKLHYTSLNDVLKVNRKTMISNSYNHIPPAKPKGKDLMPLCINCFDLDLY